MCGGDFFGLAFFHPLPGADVVSDDGGKLYHFVVGFRVRALVLQQLVQQSRSPLRLNQAAVLLCRKKIMETSSAAGLTLLNAAPPVCVTILNAWLKLKTNGWPWPFGVLELPHYRSNADLVKVTATKAKKRLRPWTAYFVRLTFVPRDVTSCVILLAKPSRGTRMCKTCDNEFCKEFWIMTLDWRDFFSMKLNLKNKSYFIAKAYYKRTQMAVFVVHFWPTLLRRLAMKTKWQ